MHDYLNGLIAIGGGEGNELFMDFHAIYEHVEKAFMRRAPKAGRRAFCLVNISRLNFFRVFLSIDLNGNLSRLMYVKEFLLCENPSLYIIPVLMDERVSEREEAK